LDRKLLSYWIRIERVTLRLAVDLAANLMLIPHLQIIFIYNSLLYTHEVKTVFIEQYSLDYSAQHSSFPSLDALFFYPYLSVSFVFRILCSCGYSTITHCMDLPLNECHIDVQALLIHCLADLFIIFTLRSSLQIL